MRSLSEDTLGRPGAFGESAEADGHFWYAWTIDLIKDIFSSGRIIGMYDRYIELS